MGSYVHDWQPQRLNGIPGMPHFDDGHAGDNGHNHFGFQTKEQAAEAVRFLRSRGIQITEYAADPGAKVGGHRDPGHYDGRSFDVPASQWSPTPDREKEIAGMRRVEMLTDEFLRSKGVPDTVLPYLKRSDGTLPAAGQSAPSSDQASTVTTTRQEQVPLDWRQAASAADRNTDPSSQGYWQRQDMRLWAEANPQLAQATMARHGADRDWLAAPQTETRTVTTSETLPVAPTAAELADQPAPAAPRPQDRGALDGTRVGGPRPRGLQPYFFEIHADAAASAGGRTGFIGSYLDRSNPLFQSLDRTYGNYGDGHSRQWRGGDLGAPRHGMSIIETRTAGPGMRDTAGQEKEASRLLQAVLQDPDVKSGKRPLHFFAGHADTTNPGQQGAAGGDAPEKEWNTGVLSALRRQVQQNGYTNFQFHDSIVDNDDKGSNTNWARAAQLRQQWLQQQQGGTP